MKFPLLNRRQRYLGCSYVLEPMFNLVRSFEHYEVSLDQFEVFHPVLLESHKQEIIVKLAEFSAFGILLFRGVRF